MTTAQRYIKFCQDNRIQCDAGTVHLVIETEKFWWILNCIASKPEPNYFITQTTKRTTGFVLQYACTDDMTLEQSIDWLRQYI